MWKTKRDTDFNNGSMVIADGLMLATDLAKTLYLIEPNPQAFKMLASAELLSEQKNEGGRSSRFGTRNRAPIALSKGKLLIRDQSRMMCVQEAE